MKILVINSGSSSIKVKLFDMPSKNVLDYKLECQITNYDKALEDIFNKFKDVDVYAHRVVHGGDIYKSCAIVNQKIIHDIDSLSTLAPLHNPINLKAIKYIQKYYPLKHQIAVFDTAFHQTIPQYAYMYPLPIEITKKYKIRKYGFHGTSHKYLMIKTANYLGIDQDKINLITLHLGNGASVCAIKNGKSIDTSMGFTPLEGLMMGSRSGDIDSAIITYLADKLDIGIGAIDNMLNKQSGFKGIAKTNDVQKIEQEYKNNNTIAKLAIDMFVYRVKKYIGSYKEILGKVDAIVFSGGIGENSSLIRELILDIDNSANYNITDEITPLVEDKSVLIVKTDEEVQIATEAYEILNHDKS